MFEAFGVEFGVFGGDAHGHQQIDDRAVAGADVIGELLTCLGEKDPAIGPGNRKALALEAADGLGGGGVGDAHARGNIGDAGFPIRGNQIADHLGIVFQQGHGLSGARLVETLGLLRHLGRSALVLCHQNLPKIALLARSGSAGLAASRQQPSNANASARCSRDIKVMLVDRLVAKAIFFCCLTLADERFNSIMTETSSQRAQTAMEDVLAGRRRGPKAWLLFAGPAVVASIAYLDPGNYATNIQAGAGYGYTLLWVVVAANLIAMLFQGLSARLGIVTGRNLAELCRDHFSRPVVWVMWIVSEIAAMATDLAEFLGAAIGLSLLFDMPLLVAMIVAAIVTYGILLFEGRGFRPMELIIGAFVGVIGLCYLIETFIAPIAWGEAGLGMVMPILPDSAALTLVVGIIGATVMPHAIYLHSGLMQHRVKVRNDADRKKVLRFSNIEVVLALAVAGMVNIAMVMMAASAFHAGHSDVAEIETAYHTLTPLLGAAAAGIFLTSLIASGISSSVVGTMAGQLIMQGFTNFRLPIWFRRLITMLPAFVVVAMGIDATTALVLSQVVLSIALPVPMIALIIFSSRGDVMGQFRIGLAWRSLAILAAALVLALNAILLLQTFGIPLPGLPTP